MNELNKILKIERKFEKKHRLLALIAAVILLLLFFLYFFYPYNTKEIQTNEKIVEVSDFTNSKVSLAGKIMFDVIIAQTPEQQKNGLSIFNKIQDYQGMLFYFQEKSYPMFWMKDMKFDIDLVWINDNIIVDIEKNMSSKKEDQLKIVSPIDKVNFVLEVNSGLIDKYNIKIGDRVDFYNIIFTDKD